MPSIPFALRSYARDARAASAHAPVEVLLGLVVAITFMVAMHVPGNDDWWLRLAAGAALALPLVFGLSIFTVRGVLSPAVRWAATAIVLALSAAFAVLLFDPSREAEGWRFGSLLAAAVLALMLTPAVGESHAPAARRRVWHFNATLLVRVVTVGAYAAVLYAALAGAVAAVASLFELDAPAHLYQDLAGAIFFGLLPWVIVGGLPTLVAWPEAESDEAPLVVRLLGRYLYSLVLTLYLAILAAYTLKVALTWELPRNLLSPIVLLAGLGGSLGSLYLEPLLRDRKGGYTARLIRWFPAVLLPLLPLALWAVWVRVDEHGWTELRYLRFALLLALLALATAGVGRLIRRRPPLLAAVPAVFGVVLLFSALGPWSAQAVSRRDQQGRLRSGLRAIGLLTDARSPIILPTDSVRERQLIPRALHDRITGAAQYLYREHGPEALRGIVANVDRFASGWELARALPIEASCEPEQLRHLASQLAMEVPIGEVPSGTLYRLRAESADPQHPPLESADAGGLQLGLTGSELRLVSREATGWTATVELQPLVDALTGSPAMDCDARADPDARLTPEQARFPLVDTAGESRGVLILTSLIADREGDDGMGPLRVRHVEALAVVR